MGGWLYGIGGMMACMFIAQNSVPENALGLDSKLDLVSIPSSSVRQCISQFPKDQAAALRSRPIFSSREDSCEDPLRVPC